MSPGEVTPAIILRTRPLGEADLVVVLLTPGQGKVEAAATHARASKKRFPGGLHPGMIGDATIARGRGALLRLGAFEARRSHAPVGQDLTRFAYVAYVCELCDELVLTRQEDPQIFEELDHTLAALIEGAPRTSELRRFELALLDALGLLPALDACCVCGEVLSAVAEDLLGPRGDLAGEDRGEPAEDLADDLADDPPRDSPGDVPHAPPPAAGRVGPSTPARVHFDGARGGALCAAHGAGAGSIDAEVLRLAVGLLHGADQGAVEAAPAGRRRDLRDLSYGLLRSHLRRPLRSLAFLAELPRVGAG
ncbi:MAG: DNA repair protein RecO [Nannocystaceae bacterium]